MKTTRALDTSAKAKDDVSLCNRTNAIEGSKQYSSTAESETQQSCKKLRTRWKSRSFDDSLAIILNDNGNVYTCTSQIE